MHKVFIESTAEKDLRRLSTEVHERAVAAIRKLAENPRPANCRKLSGTANDWRIRVGDYRVIYEISDGSNSIFVNRVRHRREVYR